MREEYERVRSEKEESEQRVEKLFVKQNSVAHERKEKKEQRDEAQRYKEKEAELVRVLLRCTPSLWSWGDGWLTSFRMPLLECRRT